MTKPRNRIALALWVAAIAVTVLHVFTMIALYMEQAQISEVTRHALDTDEVMLKLWLGMLGQAIIPSAYLFALSAVVELLDQIRWDANQRSLSS